ncbi:MAG: hypothetical protein AAB433_13335 [Nitrospirota bacterium]
MVQISLGFLSLCFIGFLVLKKTPGREFVNVHLINFLLLFLLVDILNQFLSGYTSRHDESYMVAAILLSLLYVLLIWTLSTIPSFKRTSQLAFDVLASDGYPFSQYAILLWLAFKTYLWGRYGLQSLSYLALFEQGGTSGSPLSYVETTILTSLLYLANGAVVALVVRVSHLGCRQISAIEWLLLIVFFVFILLGEAPLGVRRTVILYAIIFITTYSNANSNSFKILGLSIAIGAIGIAFIEYYQQIRFNASNPEIYHLLSSGNASDILSGIAAYLTPGTQSATTHGFRTGGLDYLATCIRAVEKSGDLMEGSLLLFSLYKVIPSPFYEGKSTLDIDTYVSSFFRMEQTDYAANLLANLYVDVGIFSIILAPILWWSIIFVMLLILSRARTNSPFALSVSGMIFGMLSLVEGSLISLFTYFRDIFIILPIFYLIGVLLGKLKSTSVTVSSR